ncbi:MAG TPA: hypothetical protein VLE97_06350 [Gaiellaceae bacterium]|nr:hypothetical protein [Gaiellaceae bacterium]
MCGVCGAGEGALTTDCPGERVAHERQQEVFETSLDFTDDRGWHLAPEGTRRSPRFEKAQIEPQPPRGDPRALVAPTVDWARVDRNAAIQHELSLKAIAWVLADRACDDQSAKLAHTEDETDTLRGKTELDDSDRALLARLEREQIDFRLSSQRAEKCEDEWKQTARRLVEALEAGPLAKSDLGPPE